MKDKWDEFRESLGAKKVDDLLACFGLGPKYVPVQPKKTICPQCHSLSVTSREVHPDTDMNAIELSCSECGWKEEP